MEIRSTITADDAIAAIYGFGSFFRGEEYNDVDLLVVASAGCRDLLALYYTVRSRLMILGKALGFSPHLTFLTAREFEERPLREMNRLVKLWCRRRSSR